MPADPWPQVEQALRDRLFYLSLPPPLAAQVIVSLHHAYCATCNARGVQAADEFALILESAVDALR